MCNSSVKETTNYKLSVLNRWWESERFCFWVGVLLLEISVFWVVSCTPVLSFWSQPGLCDIFCFLVLVYLILSPHVSSTTLHAVCLFYRSFQKLAFLPYWFYCFVYFRFYWFLIWSLLFYPSTYSYSLPHTHTTFWIRESLGC